MRSTEELGESELPMINPDKNPPSRLITAKTKFWLNLFSAIVFTAIAGTGVLNHWILPKGSNRIRLTWLGFDRHVWSNFHFWLGVTFLVLLVLHLSLHWSWVRTCWSRFVGSLRSPLTWIVLLLMLALLVMPFLIPPRGVGTGAGSDRNNEGRQPLWHDATDRGHNRR